MDLVRFDGYKLITCHLIQEETSTHSLFRKSPSLHSVSVKSSYKPSTRSSTATVVNGNLTSLGANTLSMVSSPWSIDSLPLTDSTNQAFSITSQLSSFSDSMFPQWRDSGLTSSSSSINESLPESSTSYGITSPSVRTQSRTTVTLLNYALSSKSITNEIPILRKLNDGETLSVWTVESFTSPGLTISKCTRSDIVKPRYPWSPDTLISYTDVYPSSIDSLISRKGSWNLTTPGTLSTRNLTAMNYLVFGANLNENPALDWLIVKIRGLFDTPEAISI